MRAALLTGLAAAALGCGGGGECGPLMASGEGLAVTVTQEGGCGGGTWMATATMDGRTQTVAGDRDGPVTRVLVGDISGDGRADLVVAAEANRIFAFVRQGGVLFGRELPAPPSPGTVAIAGGTLQVGAASWDDAAEAWAVR